MEIEFKESNKTLAAHDTVWGEVYRLICLETDDEKVYGIRLDDENPEGRLQFANLYGVIRYVLPTELVQEVKSSKIIIED